jgi:hypothetical protein
MRANKLHYVVALIFSFALLRISGISMDTCNLGSRDENLSASIKAHPDFKSSPSFLNMDLVPDRTGKRPQTMTCLPHAQMTEQSPDDVFALLLQRANDLVGGSVTIGHSMVSMPSSYPAYHLLESFGEMPRGSIMVPGSDAREFAHFHATFLPDTDPLVVAKKKRGNAPALLLCCYAGARHYTIRAGIQ